MHYHPQDPTRPLDWRWQEARQGVPGKRELRYCDPMILPLARWIRRKGSDPRRWPEPAGELAGLRQAALVELAGGERRDELRARLLSDQSHDAVARAMDLPPAAVALFSPVFHDVGPRQAVNAVLLRAFKVAAWQRRPPTTGEIWGYLGYFGGIHVLELVLAEHFGRAEPADPQRARSAHIARKLVLSHAEGLRDLTDFTETLELADAMTAYQHHRGIRPDPLMNVHLGFMRMLMKGRTGCRGTGIPSASPPPGGSAAPAHQIQNDFLKNCQKRVSV